LVVYIDGLASGKTHMKIKAISRELSDGEVIALKTEPPLTPEVFDAIGKQELRPGQRDQRAIGGIGIWPADRMKIAMQRAAGDGGTALRLTIGCTPRPERTAR
jgi:hypothetical protein